MKMSSEILKRINNKLDLPQPIKSRVILEIAVDFDDVYQYYLSTGLNKQQAKQKTEEKFDFTDEALLELTHIHQNIFRRLFDKLSEQGQTLWERIVLILVMIFFIAVSINTILTTPFFLRASNFIWPIFGLSFIIFILSLVKFYNLYIKKDHNIKNLRKGLLVILFLGSANIIICILGYFIELYNIENLPLILGSHLIFITITTSIEMLPIFVEWTIKITSMIILTLFFTMVFSMIWFTFLNRIKKIEQAEAAFLLQD